MTSAAFQQMEMMENMQTMFKVLLETNPTNETVQKELGRLTNNKDTHLKHLLDLWHGRKLHIYTELAIKQACSAHYANEVENAVIDELQGRTTNKMESRNWVIKTDVKWIGWDPEKSEYFKDPIMFEGELKFSQIYEQLVISDKESGSCNLIWTIKKLIKRGSDSCLSDANWISLWLQFSRKFMSSSYPTISRYSDDLERLFVTLVANVNADEEIGKLRSTMAKLHRKQGEQVQLPLYKLKSFYELLLGITFPQMDNDTAIIRSDNYSATCSKYFVTSNTAAVVAQYIGWKTQKGEPINVMGVCQVISNHENATPTDMIQSTMYLPEIATRLDTQMSIAKNVEELVIKATNIDTGNSNQQRGRSRNRSGYTTPNGTRYQQRGRSKDRAGFTSPNGTRYRQQGQSADRAIFQSPGGTKYPRRGQTNNTSYHTSPNGTRYQQRGRSNTRRDGFTSPNGTKYRQRGNSSKRAPFTSPGGRHYRPRSTSAGRFQSPGGRRYNRSPGGREWRKSSASGNPTQQQHCLRCGDNHPSVECPTYPYYRGTPCERCNLQHATTSHKERRSGSASRNKVGGNVQHNQTEIVTSTEVPAVENLSNYFISNSKN